MRMARTLGVLVTVLPALVPAQEARPKTKALPPPPEGVRIERDVVYLGEGREEKADLYLPATEPDGKGWPAVVIIHGGGFTGGVKDAAREFNIGTNLALNGYVGMSINYVLASKDRPTWPQNVHDCKTAVRWLRKNAGRLHVNAERIGVIGGSAGGHLATMLTLTRPSDGLDPAGPYGEYSCRVQCGVDLYGPAELTKDRAMLGKTHTEAPELYRAASPITYIDKDDPPLLIMHGTADTTVDVAESIKLAEAMKKAGARHELVIVEGAPHTFHLQPKQRDLRPVVLGFFNRYLKDQPAPKTAP